MSDESAARKYAEDFFKIQIEIHDDLADHARDAIENFDKISEIPEESSAWNWGATKDLIKFVLGISPFRGAMMVYEGLVEGGGKVISWIDKGTKMAESVGVKFDAPKASQPKVKDKKLLAVSARDGVGDWETRGKELLLNHQTYFTGKLLDALKETKCKDHLLKTYQEILGPQPVYEAKRINKFGQDFELSLYKKCYSKAAYIRKTSPNYGRVKVTVANVPREILNRVKQLKQVGTDLHAVNDWNLRTVKDQCNSCHSPSRMRKKSKWRTPVLMPKNVDPANSDAIGDWIRRTGATRHVKETGSWYGN